MAMSCQEKSNTARLNFPHRVLCLNMLVRTLGVCHITEHDLTDLQRCLAKADFKDLDVAALHAISV